jgi:hypothetical protein
VDPFWWILLLLLLLDASAELDLISKDELHH